MFLKFKYSIVTDIDAQGKLVLKKYPSQVRWGRGVEYGINPVQSGVVCSDESPKTVIKNKEWVIDHIDEINNANVSGDNVYFVRNKGAKGSAGSYSVTLSQEGVGNAAKFKIGNRNIQRVYIIPYGSTEPQDKTSNLILQNGSVTFKTPNPITYYVVNDGPLNNFLAGKNPDVGFVIYARTSSLYIKWDYLGFCKPKFEVTKGDKFAWWSNKDSRMGLRLVKSEKYPLYLRYVIFNSDDLLSSRNMGVDLCSLFDTWSKKVYSELFEKQQEGYADIQKLLRERTAQLSWLTTYVDKLIDYVNSYTSEKLEDDYSKAISSGIAPHNTEKIRREIARIALQNVGMLSDYKELGLV